jgi:hypothetical protein
MPPYPSLELSRAQLSRYTRSLRTSALQVSQQRDAALAALDAFGDSVHSELRKLRPIAREIDEIRRAMRGVAGCVLAIDEVQCFSVFYFILFCDSLIYFAMWLLLEGGGLGPI